MGKKLRKKCLGVNGLKQNGTAAANGTETVEENGLGTGEAVEAIRSILSIALKRKKSKKSSKKCNNSNSSNSNSSNSCDECWE
ncbi:hypothetical protein [Fictibacillus barbaricus]|uniref:Uncharacterized protein n=1 Tax=Fictibacillus barbaricus TaxID=182136 RepID=A0ABS2ZDC8_9BACL|nr:hypothetical protein [Fictibacillus barbaricus]MBN3544730.1 hypothetical protein [Fictibacillus barbaricus]GGB64432.1 hypothetical protein GCM10007199_33250 [Fictibacillus barbaricus]